VASSSSRSPAADAGGRTHGGLAQDRLERAFRDLLVADHRVRAALTYGSRPAGLGDAFSDVEFWVFVDDAALGLWSVAHWIAQVATPDLLVRNESGGWVAVVDRHVRVELHVWPASDTDVVRGWPGRGAPVEAMVVIDRDGRLVPALTALPQHAPAPATSDEVAALCGRFANWWLLGRNVLARGEDERALDALAHVRRYLLWMARVDEGATDRWLTPSRWAEWDLSGEILAGLRRIGGGHTPGDDLGEAFVAAWELGVRLWGSLARTWEFRLPPLAEDPSVPDVPPGGPARRRPDVP
jgi:lincosamide nucleotidyltransferase B/F